MALEFSIEIDSEEFEKSIENLSDEYESAFDTTKNMIASMIKTRSIADIESAGNFGTDYTGALTVEVDSDTITTTLDAPGASIFETGGTIQGHPLLWIGISGTDAEGTRASNYSDGLFSVNRKAGGVPLLFSVRDHTPKFFGISSVFIPKKFHLEEIQTSVMENFTDVFKDALGHG
jgi:hypothetical protein